MGDHGHQAVDVDPKALDEAQAMWSAFAKGGKYATIATALLLAVLALAFIDFS
ncbi:MAG: aa3-type cytochrome c oxidase subunit IV [Alphaproteobacteria bacterium]|nr:aa3-type cytochrome c oxidase subunit IV [Alphaproteobacteria bacterium]